MSSSTCSSSEISFESGNTKFGSRTYSDDSDFSAIWSEYDWYYIRITPNANERHEYFWREIWFIWNVWLLQLNML